jgi:aminoglycoside phosphotransferase family enzyme/predicted kinase
MSLPEQLKTTTEPNLQEELLRFLSNPASYPHRPQQVKVIQTHASLVFLVPPFVYKIKKPVDFGFLDYSSLEKRRQFCEREIELNRRLCPGTYLGVVSITVENNRLAFSGNGKVIEHAVKMRKLPERGFLDKLVERGAVGPRDLDRIVETLRRFYQTRRPTIDIEKWGRIDSLRISTDENFRQTEKFVGRTLSSHARDAIRHYTDQVYIRGAEGFDSRVRGRRILECHGDLRLEHVHLTRSKVQIYDCIEFNERFRCLDVANDLAFLAMDFDFFNRPDLAAYFTQKMTGALDDPDLPRFMDFYKCYRAYVRGKIESFDITTTSTTEAGRRLSGERARRYFRLALRYAVAGSHPSILAVTGRVATGKSALSRAIGHELDWPVLSSDHIRKEMAGFPVYKRSSETVRRWLYSPEITQRTYDRLLELAALRAEKGGGAILDATFASADHRKQLDERLALKKTRLRIIEVTTDDDIVRSRLRQRETATDEASDARIEDLDKLNERYETQTNGLRTNSIRVEGNGPVDTTLTEALRKLVDARLETAWTRT